MEFTGYDVITLIAVRHYFLKLYFVESLNESTVAAIHCLHAFTHACLLYPYLDIVSSLLVPMKVVMGLAQVVTTLKWVIWTMRPIHLK